MESLYGRHSRFEMSVPSKRGRIPSVIGLHPKSRTKVELVRHSDANSLSVGASEGEDESPWMSFLQSSDHGRIFVPKVETPEADTVAARFIGKVAIEVLTQRIMDVPGANDEIVDRAELDPLRRYVRLGQPKSVWPVNVRRIYPPDFVFSEPDGDGHEVLHEWTILYTHAPECYVVIAIFGVEYVINLGGPALDGYECRLEENSNKSPLYNEPDACQ